MEDRHVSAVRNCLFNIFAATLRIGGRSSIRNLRLHHAVVTRTHLSRDTRPRAHTHTKAKKKKKASLIPLNDVNQPNFAMRAQFSGSYEVNVSIIFAWTQYSGNLSAFSCQRKKAFVRKFAASIAYRTPAGDRWPTVAFLERFSSRTSKLIWESLLFHPTLKFYPQLHKNLSIYSLLNQLSTVYKFAFYSSKIHFNPYPTAFPYGNGMVLHFYQQQESSTTKTVHKVIKKRLKAYV